MAKEDEYQAFMRKLGKTDQGQTHLTRRSTNTLAIAWSTLLGKARKEHEGEPKRDIYQDGDTARNAAAALDEHLFCRSISWRISFVTLGAPSC